jgi:[glutamine synthetase] adenylyltransferase / [glutamine synthetase]-adenylyl-L-tyrosine phosphorylase
MPQAASGKRPKPVTDKKALARQVTGALPRASTGGRGRVTEWLKSIARTRAGNSISALLQAHPGMTRVLAGIADGSPFLWDLVRADPARSLRLFGCDPDTEFVALLRRVREAAGTAEGSATLMRVLRHLKAEAALLIALADIGGVWSVAQVTAALSAVAETILGAAVRHVLGEAAFHGKLNLPDPKCPELGVGFVVLAMGKLGGNELNFSSDIDLMVFFDAAAGVLSEDVAASPFFVRLTRDLVRLLQERTADGYVYRVDLRLRPDPSSTQIAISIDAALDYYESRGQNWERAALIKARPCAGDHAAGERLLDELSPFVWRKYLDYATVADIHAMKQEIHAYRGHGEIAVEGHNVKLGRGGIREIEFFVQTQQLIAGGRHPGLRGRETIAMLAALAADGWIDVSARDELTAAYFFLRRVEHRLQMVADEQIHTLPTERAALDAFAKFLGYKGRDECAVALLKHLRAVEKHYVKLFEDAPALLAQEQSLSFPTRSIGLRRWAFDSRANWRRRSVAGLPSAIVPCAANRRAKISVI